MYGVLLIALIAIGFVLGKFSNRFILEKNQRVFSKTISLFQNISIFLLLSLMGYKIGSNKDLISNFSTIRLHSVLFGIVTLLSSAMFTWVFVTIAKKVHFKKRNKKLKSHIPFHVDEDESSQIHNLIMIFVFLGLVVLGGFLGYYNVLSIKETALTYLVDGSLMALVFFIGIDMGISQLNMEHIKSISKSVVLICLGVVFGSLIGALALGLILGYDWLYSLAIGCPMGWYSLAGIMFSKISEELGAITFSANLVRELSAIALVPLLGNFVSKESAISACGATAMDTTLPAITKGLGKQYAVTGFACGIIISSIVPFFLSIIQIIYGII